MRWPIGSESHRFRSVATRGADYAAIRGGNTSRSRSRSGIGKLQYCLCFPETSRVWPRRFRPAQKI